MSAIRMGNVHQSSMASVRMKREPRYLDMLSRMTNTVETAKPLH
jgi:hypothetical protein